MSVEEEVKTIEVYKDLYISADIACDELLDLLNEMLEEVFGYEEPSMEIVEVMDKVINQAIELCDLINKMVVEE